MSEAYISLDVCENPSQEIVVGYPVKSNWFFSYIPRSSSETTNDINVDHHRYTSQSTNTTRRVLDKQTQGTSVSSDRHKLLCFNTGKCRNYINCFVFFLGLVVCIAALMGVFAWASTLPVSTPFKFKVIQLDVASMTISNNDEISDILNFNMSADLNLTLSMINQDHKLLIEHLIVSIKYFDEILSSTKIGPLCEDSEGLETIQLDMGFKEARVTNAIIDSMLNDLAVDQTLKFSVIMKGRYAAIDEILTSEHAVEIMCEGVNVKFSPASNFTVGTMHRSPCSCKQTTITP